MKLNGFVWTEAYEMKSKHILHVNADKFLRDGGLESVFNVCLTEANNLGMKVIALPAFGTGTNVLYF
jgi:O-acetyl-ADP-ribose deacetylase (regulator of RNase III)